MSALIGRLARAAGRRDDGQDILEYALLAALIVVAAIGAVRNVGSTISSVFWDVIAAGTPAA
jgi:Flp pilus assembly pilin Flp